MHMGGKTTASQQDWMEVLYPLYLICDSDSFAFSDGQFVVSGLSTEVIQNLHLQEDGDRSSNKHTDFVLKNVAALCCPTLV